MTEILSPILTRLGIFMPHWEQTLTDQEIVKIAKYT